ncbi:hypothetical protein DUNSADRAFT_12728 [Dunaliella salina]|uniref:Uncharacterized protein n=1 Tax=Dunaliella salina TaxID=3046 RepID=A0ABQ7FRP8_DUNSA|nr:hypothetical protein DUNSADRAFT_12728 [Dunaliella salina]|eukprot:KAF5825262.1 hypothetical protein DUNSADRAFT_12728 [Dunaliella salina]
MSTVELVEGCPKDTETRFNAEALWGYDMKMGAPATALSLFYLTGLIILIQLLMARNRNTFYMVIVVLAAWAEGGEHAS